MQRKSLIGSFFSALIDIVQGIREVIVAFIFGKDALEVDTPQDNSQIFDTDKSQAKKTTLEKAKAAPVKDREKSQKKEKEYKREKSKGNLDEIDDAAHSPHKVSFKDANEQGESSVGSKSTPISQMSFENFSKSLTDEFRAEYQMNPSNGVIEIGGRYFEYAPDNERIVGDVEMKDVLLRDSTTGALICSMNIASQIMPDGESKVEYTMSELSIKDMTLFGGAMEQEKTQAHENQKENELVPIMDESVINAFGGETIACNEPLEQPPAEEIIYEDEGENQQKLNLEPLPAPSSYQEFMDTIQQIFGADKIMVTSGYIQCHKDPASINPEAPDAGIEDYRISVTGAIDGRYGAAGRKAVLSFMTPEERGRLQEYVAQYMPIIKETLEYKLNAALSTGEKKSGTIDDVRYMVSGKKCRLTNNITGKEIGYIKNGAIKYSVDASNLREAVMVTGYVSKESEQTQKNMPIATAVEAAKRGNMEEFTKIVDDYDVEQIAKLAEELETATYITNARTEKEGINEAIKLLNEKAVVTIER